MNGYRYTDHAEPAVFPSPLPNDARPRPDAETRPADDHDEELIDDFLRRLDQSVEAHIEGRLEVHGSAPPRRHSGGKRAGGRRARLLIAALVLAIPLFAFSASFGAFMGLFFGITSHHVIVGLITMVLVTVGTFSAVALVLAVGALIYLDRRRS